MSTSKYVRLLIGILLACSFTGCSLFPPQAPQPSNVENWPIGTSAGRLGRLDKTALGELKQAGFDCIEIGLGRIRTADDLAVMQEQARQLNQLAQDTGVKIWSIHIPYGRDIDVSQIDQIEREKAIEEVSRMITLCEYLQPEAGDPRQL